MKSFLLVALFVLGQALASGYAFAQDSDDSEPVRCISLSRIDETEILDDHRILFHMRGGDAYLNELSYACPGLRPDRTLMYRTSTGRICDVDIVTVLENWGFSYTPAASCGLGMFTPVDDEQIEVLKGERTRGVTVEPVERTD